jgi:methionine sulfoxide reductase catalytic subunit
MKRRHFLAALAATAGEAAAGPNEESKILLPTDTPDRYGFRIMWYNPVAPIDKPNYRLKVNGLVEKPLELSMDELRELPQVSQNSRMKCVQCWSSRATWGGFRFEPFLDRVKPKKTARAVRFDCADKWYEYMSMEEMLSPRVLLTLDLDGKPLADDHGAPLRLLDPSKYGYKSAKLILSLTFVEEGKGSMACDIGPYYSPTGEIQSGYDHPLDLGANVRKKIRGGEITEY